MSRLTVPYNLKGKDLYKFLAANKGQLIATKKANIKYTDNIIHQPVFITSSKAVSIKKNGDNQVSPIEEDGHLHVKVVGNSAWWCDSQMDVLTNTCYDKSIKEKGILIPHIADHKHLSTNHVGDVEAVYTQKVSLKELGLSESGTTTCFVMETDVREDYNQLTYKFYKNGKINQHSIGLVYVSIGLCINDKEYLPEYELWQKYYDKVINKDLIDEEGYFWIVPEIKIMENSCVLFGANELTPTLEVNTDTGKSAAKPGTENQPSDSNKSRVICPSCETSFQAPDEGNINCPGCGQYVSPGSNTIQTASFDLLSAISQTNFIH
jgi:hypothetical protein